MISAFTYGLKTGTKMWRVALIGYIFQFLMAMTLGMQVYQVFEASIGQSLEINKLLQGFDDTVLTDFMNVHGASLSPLLGQLRYLLLVYFIFSVFINAGLLYSVVGEKGNWKSFWKGGATYFFRFLKVGLIYLIIWLAWSAMLWVPFIVNFQSYPEIFPSEKGFVFLIIALLLVYFLGLVWLFNSSVCSRLDIIKTNVNVVKAIKSGVKKGFCQYFSLTGLFFLFLGLQLVVFGIYWLAEGVVGMISPFTILLFFLIQQFVIFFRWLFKLSMYAGIDRVVENENKNENENTFI